jgi:hypothetical protein
MTDHTDDKPDLVYELIEYAVKEVDQKTMTLKGNKKTIKLFIKLMEKHILENRYPNRIRHPDPWPENH